MPYDSKADTLEHIRNVNHILIEIVHDLLDRAARHDESKLHEPEKSVFDSETPKLKELTYGSEEYKQSLENLGPALTHHYQMNRHHPEHYDNGVAGMDLIDLVEMFCDWKAASMRTKRGSMHDSIKIGSERFNLDPQLTAIFYNTAGRLGL